MTEKQSSYICRSCLYGCWQKFRETSYMIEIWFHCAMSERELNDPIADTGEDFSEQCFWYHKVKK